MSQKADEAELLTELRAGSDTAARQLVSEHIGWMRGLATRILNNSDAADDCVQDAFINAFRHIEHFKGDAALKTWLHRIVVNTALMRLRKIKRLNEQSIEDLQTHYNDMGMRVNEPAQHQHTPTQLLEREDLRSAVAEAISQLPENYRIVLQLRDIEELTTAEVAATLSISEANVKVRLHRGRTALKTLLDPIFTGDDRP